MTKVINIGSDQNIFNPESEVRARSRARAFSLEKLLVLVAGASGRIERDGNLELLSMPLWRSLFFRPAEKFDLVTSQDPFEHGLISWFLAWRLGAELELQIHTDFLSPHFWRASIRNKIRVILARFLLPRADQIRVVSNRIKNSLIANRWRLKAIPTVRPIAVEAEKIKSARVTVDLHQKYPQFQKIILMASRLTREKNIALAIEAMAEVVKKLPQAGLIIVGSGPLESELKLQARSSKLEANVVFEPWVDQATLWSYYKTADLFLLTSLYEGYGLTLAEAQAAGCPIVATDVGVARELGVRIVESDARSVAAGLLDSLS